MREDPSLETRESVAWVAILVPSLGTLALHLLVNALDSYGIFRDEYYYVACAKRLAFGYVDQPPLSLALLAGQTALIGDGLFALRWLPSLLAGAMVLLTALTARELGAARWGQGLAALLAACVPSFLGLCGYYSMNSIDLLIWAAATLLVARIANATTASCARSWIMLGVVLGLGLLNKVSVLYLGVGLTAALLGTPLRSSLGTRWPWVSAAIATTMFAPYLVWQELNGWPTLAFTANAAEFKNVQHTPLSFLKGVMFETSPLFVVFWPVAVVFAFGSSAMRRHRWVGWLPITVVTVLIVTGSAKPYYADPAFVPLIAAFGFAVERWARPRMLRVLVATYVVLAGLVTAPFAIPLLPVETFIKYSQALSVSPPAAERSSVGALPQFYADRFGWRTLAEHVASAYASLDPSERAIATVFGQNYGQAASLEYLSREFDLPPAISAHNSYWIWGPGALSGTLLIVVGDERERLLELFQSVELASVKHCMHCMPFENEVPIWICRDMKMTPEELWGQIANFI